MANMKGVKQTNNDNFSTPDWLFNDLNKEFGFTVDVCASKENAKCPRFFTKEMDGLKQSWEGERCFLNPPYGREIAKWVEKASKEKALTVALLPASTDTGWFFDYIYHKAEIRFVKGRLRFGNSKYKAMFPSIIVIWRNDRYL